MITFWEACDLVQRARRPTWDPTWGTFFVDRTYGLEDDDGWLIVQGAREFLRDGDYRYMIIGGGLPVVDKRTGKIDWLSPMHPTHGPRIEAMTPVRLCF